MKNAVKYLFCLLSGCLLSTSVYAQHAVDKTSNLFVHVGPSWYVGELMGITSQAKPYRDDLRKGFSWDVGYSKALVGKDWKFGLGALYQGSLYKNTHEYGADKIQMHYLAPQLTVTFLQKHYQLQFAGGGGYQFYRDRSEVYAKSRKVSMSKLAGNFSCLGEYYIARHWGVSSRLNWLYSSSGSYSVDYHDVVWEVEPGNGKKSYFGQLSLTFGVNYHF